MPGLPGSPTLLPHLPRTKQTQTCTPARPIDSNSFLEQLPDVPQRHATPLHRRASRMFPSGEGPPDEWTEPRSLLGRYWVQEGCPQCPPHPARRRRGPTCSLPHFAADEWRPGVPRVAWTMAQPPQTPIPAGLHWGPRAGHRCRAALQAGSPESPRRCCMRSHRRTRWPHIEGRGCCGVPVCDSSGISLCFGPGQTRVPLRSVVSDPSIHKGGYPTGGRRGSTTPGKEQRHR
jgi:hypothetical protein